MIGHGFILPGSAAIGGVGDGSNVSGKCRDLKAMFDGTANEAAGDAVINNGDNTFLYKTTQYTYPSYPNTYTTYTYNPYQTYTSPSY